MAIIDLGNVTLKRYHGPQLHDDTSTTKDDTSTTKDDMSTGPDLAETPEKCLDVKVIVPQTNVLVEAALVEEYVNG